MTEALIILAALCIWIVIGTTQRYCEAASGDLYRGPGMVIKRHKEPT